MDGEVQMVDNIWKEIKEFPNYRINNLGQVLSIRRNIILKEDKSNGRGYCSVMLYKNGKPYTKVVHRLVAEAFIPNPYNKTQVNHIDGNKHNNCVENLEWVTQSENMIHAFKTGLEVHGMKNKKHSIESKNKMRKKIICIEQNKIYNGLIEAEQLLGISSKEISKCLRGNRKTAGKYHWKYLITDDDDAEGIRSGGFRKYRKIRR